MTLAGLILGLVTLQRLGELALSKRNADDHAVGFPCPSSRGRSSSRAISKCDQHGPVAKAIIAAATADDPGRGLQVLSAARQSIEARIKLWDGLLSSLNDWKQARAAAS
jgi:hypothetical protein